MLTVEGLHLCGERENGGDNRDVLTLEPGSLTLVIGANGAGKTVWLEKLAGLRNPEGLFIRYGAEPLWLPRRVRRGGRLNPKALTSFGYAGQSPEQALFLRTLEEELVFSLHPYTRSQGGQAQDRDLAIERALEAVGLNRSWLQRDPERMSGGERRRAALAALFVTPAPWLLLDEPTAGLDRQGHEKLAAHLARLKSEGRGMLLVSHDLDWALPLADRVVLLHPAGQMRIGTAEDIIAHPEWLEQAGLRLPEWMRLIRSVWESGDVELQRLWNPCDAAEVISVSSAVCRKNEDTESAQTPTASEYRDPVRARQTAPHPLTRFDPRAVWLAYALLSAALFSLSSWRGLAAGAAIVCVLLVIGRIPLKRWKGLITGFVYFSLVTACLAAVVSAWGRSGRIGWETSAFAGTLFPMARTLSVLLIGLGLPLVMTPLSVRRSLEQLVPRSMRIAAAWQLVVLTVTLTIRFVPVLLSEWERFARIFLARGKETGHSPPVFLRRIRGITLPLLLALFRLGDDAAVALESRGVRKNTVPTRATRLNWQRRDTTMAAAAAVLAGGLWLLG